VRPARRWVWQELGGIARPLVTGNRQLLCCSFLLAVNIWGVGRMGGHHSHRRMPRVGKNRCGWRVGCDVAQL